MAEHVVRQLHHVQRRFEEILERLRYHLENRELSEMAVDFTAMDAAIANLQTAASAVEADLTGDTSATAAAVAAAEATAQSGVDQRTTTIQSITTGLTGAEPVPTPTPTPTPAFSVAPVSFTVGQAAPEITLAITGGVAPFSVSGLPAGVTSNGITIADDGTAVAAVTTATLTDATGATAPLVITVA
jgi:hypothetical protein